MRLMCGSPEVVQTVLLAQLVVASSDKAQLVGRDAKRSKDGVEELRVVGDSESNCLKSSLAGIEEGMDLGPTIEALC